MCGFSNFVFAPLSSQARYQNTAWQSQPVPERKRRIGYLHQRFDAVLCLWMLIIVHPPIKNRLSAVTGGQNKSAKDRYISKLPRMKAQNHLRSAADYSEK